MGLFRRLGSGLSGTTHTLHSPRPDLIGKIGYRIASSPHGLPMVELDLEAATIGGAVANPEMTLAVLIDRSGSMTETFAEGHVYDVASAILNAVSTTGAGFDLAFYDTGPTLAEHVGAMGELRQLVDMNRPRGGGTCLTPTLRGAIERYHSRRGIYLIVITDGEFADKAEVQHYIVGTLLPQLTPENPYAFRLHFVGAGEEVDREFLRQLEADAIGQGIQLVKHHHHAHLRHSHTDILSELDGAYLGISEQVTLGQVVGPGEAPAVTRVGDLATQRWHDGHLADIGFVPRRARLGLEFGEAHPKQLAVTLGFRTAGGADGLSVQVPLPASTVQAPTVPRSRPPDATPSATPPEVPAPKHRFHLPWHHEAPEEDAAKEVAAREREALAARIAQVRQEAQSRQTADLGLLGRGGIPTMAGQRLANLRRAGPDGATFTSDLSPDEAALLRRNGYRPLVLVTGSAMYHVGIAYASSYSDCEVPVLSVAYTEATSLAAGRMQQEATLLGAHGVIGVRFEIVRREWSEKSIEVQLVGTAVSGPGDAPRTPWLSDLSGQEWWALHRAGYDPAGLVYGHCAWFVLTTQSDEWGEKSGYNQELSHMSTALSNARSRANDAVREMARGLGAAGVVGVHLTRKLEEIRLSGPGEDPAYEREHHNLTLSIVGTAVRLRPDAPRMVPATGSVLSLLDGRISPVRVSTTAARFD